MKQTLFKNLPYKILALIVAIPVWIILINIANPMATKTITGIRVDTSTKGDQIVEIDEKRYIYDITGDVVSVNVTARKKDIDEITAEDFADVFYADMNYFSGEREDEKASKIHVRWEKFPHKNLITEEMVKLKGEGQVKMHLEELVDRTFPVQINWEGDLAEDITIGKNTTIEPAQIIVTARRSAFASIQRQAIVTLDRSQVTSDTIKMSGKLSLYDGNNTLITNTEKLKLSQDEVTVYPEILKSKTINVNLSDPVGEVAPGYKCSGHDWDVKTLKVIGSKAALADLNSLEIPGDEYPKTNATSDLEYQIDLGKYLPENVRIADDNPTVADVVIKVEKLKTKNFRISTDALILHNKSEEYDYYFYSRNFVVTLQGFEEDLDSITADNIIAEVDLAEYVPNEELYSVPVIIPELNEKEEFTLVEPIYLNLRVRVKEITSEEETESESEIVPESEVPSETPEESESEMPMESLSEPEETSESEPAQEYLYPDY